MVLLATYIGLALGVSFLCSLLEATLLSLTPTYLASLEAKRPKLGAMWREFKADIDKPLAAILSLNTIVINPENSQFVGVLFGKMIKLRNLLTTGCAPDCPVIYQGQLALVIGKAVAAAIDQWVGSFTAAAGQEKGK